MFKPQSGIIYLYQTRINYKYLRIYLYIADILFLQFNTKILHMVYFLIYKKFELFHVKQFRCELQYLFNDIRIIIISKTRNIISILLLNIDKVLKII